MTIATTGKILYPLEDCAAPVEVTASAARFCQLCRGATAVDITPADRPEIAPVRVPCPHCQGGVPLVLTRPWTPGGSDARHDRPGGQHPH